jgi:copper chaperone CopZ
MTSFRVDDMTCGHCTGVITKALQAVEPGANVKVNLTTHQVDIDAPTADASRLRSAIENAGYPAVLLDGAPATAGQPAQRKSGCCCA